MNVPINGRFDYKNMRDEVFESNPEYFKKDCSLKISYFHLFKVFYVNIYIYIYINIFGCNGFK